MSSTEHGPAPGQDLIDAARGLPPADLPPGDLVQFTAARRELAAIRETFGLTLTSDERARQLQTLDRAQAMAVAGQMDDLAREIKRTIVDLKRLIAPEPKTKAEAGAEGGRGNKAEAPDAPAFTKDQVKRQRALAAVPDAVVDRVFEKAAEVGDVPSEREIIEAAKPPKAAVPGTGQEDWHTPDLYLEAARRAMGSIDFDPASSPAAQKRVKAAEYCTKDRSGLDREWKGNVWINPPYSADVIPKFADKLLGEIDAGRVVQCCWLSNASLDTRWGQRLSKAAQGLALIRGRVKFLAPGGKDAQSNAWMTVVLYFGGDVDRFADAFCGLGDVWQRS